MYFYSCSSTNLGMQSSPTNFPTFLIAVIENLRRKLLDPVFLDRHRGRPEDFTRQRQLTFPLLMLFILQRTVKSISGI